MAANLDVRAPLVSVLMPVYNVAGYLEKSIGSVLGQTLRDIELIVVDDGSSDGSAEICDRLAAADPRIRVIHKKNAGPAAARNDALDAATGKYLMFCDSDDEYRPDFCRRMVDELEKSGCDAVVCQCDFLVDEDLTQAMVRERLGKDEDYFNPDVDDTVTEDEARLFDVNVLLWNKIFKRSVIADSGIRFPVGHEHDDDAFWYQYAMVIQSVRRIRDRLYLYRMRIGSIMNSYAIGRPKNRHDRLDVTAFVQGFAEQHGLLWLYHHALVRLWMQSYSMVRGYFNAGELDDVRREIVSCAAHCFSPDYRLVDYEGELLCLLRRGDLLDLVHGLWHRFRLCFIRNQHHHDKMAMRMKRDFCYWRCRYRISRKEAGASVPGGGATAIDRGAAPVTVSVIVPVFNVAPFLEWSVRSLLAQTLRRIEVILVDDGSTDGSGAICDRLSAADSRIRVLHQANAGAGAARNAGMDVAVGEYLYFADPDDFVKSDYLARMVARADSTAADFVASDFLKCDLRTGDCRQISVRRWFLPEDAEHVPFAPADCAPAGGSELLYALSPMVWHKLYRRSFVMQRGIRFQDVRKFNDMCFALEAICVARRVVFLHGFGYIYLTHRRDSLQTSTAIPSSLIHDVFAEFERRLKSAGVYGSFRGAFLNFRERNLREWMDGGKPESGNGRTSHSLERWCGDKLCQLRIWLSWPALRGVIRTARRIIEAERAVV